MTISNNSQNLCSLNSKSQHCLPKSIINSISTFLSDDFYKANNLDNKHNIQIINLLAKQCNCPEDYSLQEKEIFILKNLRDDNKNTELGDLAEKILLKYFKPTAKRLDGDYWLNNTEIDFIQYQFQINFTGYYYSYIHMIDLNMYDPNNKNHILNHNKIVPINSINFINELKNINSQLTYNGKLKNYGIVCNTDLSSGSGIHWFSIFIDFTASPITIEYFNSSGYDLTYGRHKSERHKFYKFFINLSDDLNRNGFKSEFIKVTDIEHQRSDTANCGSYSLFYIWRRLNKLPYTYFKNNKITDEDMEKFRTFLWRKSIKS